MNHFVVIFLIVLSLFTAIHSFLFYKYHLDTQKSFNYSLTSLFNLFQFICVQLIVIIISWCMTDFIYTFYSQLFKISISSDRGVLITGCDTGFGHQLAIKLDKLGFTVFAGCLHSDSDGAKSLAQLSNKIHVIQMNVTSSDEVSRAMDFVMSKSGVQLWALVNNAGVGHAAFAEWGNDVEDVERLMQVNLYGLIRVTKMFLPILRQSKGRVVNVASIAGKRKER